MCDAIGGGNTWRQIVGVGLSEGVEEVCQGKWVMHGDWDGVMLFMGWVGMTVQEWKGLVDGCIDAIGSKVGASFLCRACGRLWFWM